MKRLVQRALVCGTMFFSLGMGVPQPKCQAQLFSWLFPCCACRRAQTCAVPTTTVIGTVATPQPVVVGTLPPTTGATTAFFPFSSGCSTCAAAQAPTLGTSVPVTSFTPVTVGTATMMQPASSFEVQRQPVTAWGQWPATTAVAQPACSGGCPVNAFSSGGATVVSNWQPVASSPATVTSWGGGTAVGTEVSPAPGAGYATPADFSPSLSPSTPATTSPSCSSCAGSALPDTMNPTPIPAATQSGADGTVYGPWQPASPSDQQAATPAASSAGSEQRPSLDPQNGYNTQPYTNGIDSNSSSRGTTTPGIGPSSTATLSPALQSMEEGWHPIPASSSGSQSRFVGGPGLSSPSASRSAALESTPAAASTFRPIPDPRTPKAPWVNRPALPRAEPQDSLFGSGDLHTASLDAVRFEPVPIRWTSQSAKRPHQEPSAWSTVPRGDEGNWGPAGG